MVSAMEILKLKVRLGKHNQINVKNIGAAYRQSSLVSSGPSDSFRIMIVMMSGGKMRHSGDRETNGGFASTKLEVNVERRGRTIRLQ